ncbi:hypothetical protein GCM10009780_53340 [Actinomadura alba]
MVNSANPPFASSAAALPHTEAIHPIAVATPAIYLNMVSGPNRPARTGAREASPTVFAPDQPHPLGLPHMFDHEPSDHRG